MSFSRYRNDNTLRGNKAIGTNQAIRKLRLAHRNGLLSVEKRVLKEGTRLDHIAQEFYGDGRLWWVIAAVSGIGWWVQAPAGTKVLVPTNIREIQEII